MAQIIPSPLQALAQLLFNKDALTPRSNSVGSTPVELCRTILIVILRGLHEHRGFIPISHLDFTNVHEDNNRR